MVIRVLTRHITLIHQLAAALQVEHPLRLLPWQLLKLLPVSAMKDHRLLNPRSECVNGMMATT